MSVLNKYKLNEKDKELFAMIDEYACDNRQCEDCPYVIDIIAAQTNKYCTLDYIYNRLVSFRESER